MRIILSVVLLLFFFLGKAQTNSDSEEGNYSPKEQKRLAKDSKKLKKFNYSKAVSRYGEPYDSAELEITKQMLSTILSEDVIREHFPDNKAPEKGAYLLEASWQMLSKSWITVWYKFDKGVWKPIDILVTI